MDEEESHQRITETEFLILEVKKYPILFNPGHTHYKNNAVRTKVWDKITESLGKTTKDRKKVMVKWKNIKKKFLETQIESENSTSKPTSKSHQSFIQSMQFILPYYDANNMIETDDLTKIHSDIKFESQLGTSEERNVLHNVSEDIWFEDAFIDEIKKHPEVYDASLLTSTKAMKRKIWNDLAEMFQESDKKLMLKWKNLRRKYVLMRYPLSSKNAFTGKRKIRYNQEFIDRLSFLDNYLNASIIAKDDIDDAVMQEIHIKEEMTDKQMYILQEISQDEINEDTTSTNDQEYDQNLYEENQDETMLESDETQEHVQMLFQTDNDNQDLYEEDEEPPPKKSKANTIVVKNDSAKESNHLYDTVDYFCLSLAEPIRRMNFMSQQRVKEKIFAVINEQLNCSYSKLNK